VNRLRQAIRSSGLQRLHLLAHVLDHGENDHRNVAQVRSRGLQGEKLQAVEHRHHDVAQHEVDLSGYEQHECVEAVGCRQRSDLRQPLLKYAADILTSLFRVVYDQDGLCHEPLASILL